MARFAIESDRDEADFDRRPIVTEWFVWLGRRFLIWIRGFLIGIDQARASGCVVGPAESLRIKSSMSALTQMCEMRSPVRSKSVIPS